MQTKKLKGHPKAATSLSREPLQHPESLVPRALTFTHLRDIRESPAAQEERSGENCPSTGPPGVRLVHPDHGQLAPGGKECDRPHWAGGALRLCLLVGASSQGRAQRGGRPAADSSRCTLSALPWEGETRHPGRGWGGGNAGPGVGLVTAAGSHPPSASHKLPSSADALPSGTFHCPLLVPSLTQGRLQPCPHRTCSW